MKILAIETSCDETAAAVTEGRRVLSNVIFSQINIHRQWGGVYPSLAKRAHEEKIDQVVSRALKNARIREKQIGAVAVTFGPGLVIALEVGLEKAKMLAKKWQKPLIPVDHLEGHLYSPFAQNQKGNPSREINFPFLGLIVSGGHTSLVKVRNYLDYEIVGQTLDDALGEALDKAAKILGLGYPGGPVMERLAKKGNPDFLALPVALKGKKTLDFSYSGLKTAFKYQIETMSQAEIRANLVHLAASFQKAAFVQITDRLQEALLKEDPLFLAAGGGVIANQNLKQRIRRLAKKEKIKTFFPPKKNLTGDNAAMIGVAAHFKYQKGIYLKNDIARLDRVARPDLKLWVKPEAN